ncbi:MAG: 50S ribosomal protein L30 [Marinilabiliales bacterium]|nr:MAG: 50S ribosomal protein L30 [Marinilabiliales bacterium]
MPILWLSSEESPLIKCLTVKRKTMKKIRITLVRSQINRPEIQRKTIKALGLTKMNSSVEKDATPQILGMVRKVSHLVKVEEI